MTDDPETPEDEDDDEYAEVYEPRSVQLMEGTVAIHDEDAWAEEMNALATQFQDGNLFVLRRDSRKWMKVEPFPDATKVRAIKTVQ